ATRGAFVAAIAACAGVAVVLSGMAGWRGGWSVGPRYLSPLPPFFAMGALIALELAARASDLARTVARGVAVGLAAAGALSLGLVSILFDTVPEETTRPLAQLAL